MADNNEGSGGAFLAGVLVGGAIGAVAALLLAPERGEDTRTLIAQKSGEYADTVKAKTGEVAEAVKAKTGEVTETVKQSANDLSAKTQDAVEQLKAKSSDIASDLADKATTTANTVKESATTAINKGKALVEAGTTAVQGAIADGRDAANDAKSNLQAQVADIVEPGA